MTHTVWRKSTFSAGGDNCVELAATGDAIRDSKHPDRGHVVYAVAELAALVDACACGRLDHLAG